MKFKHFLLFSVAMLFSNFTSYSQTSISATESPVPHSYDINKDGVVDILDINILAASIIDSNGVYNENCDINGDGVIDVLDINMDLKLIMSPPRGCISWIDDDFIAFDWSTSEVRPIYRDLHDFCMEHNIKPDIARGSFSYPYDKLVPPKQLATCLQWQSDGFTFLYHPNHSMGWYNYSADCPHDTTKIEESIIDCFRGFEFYGFNAPKILVWPGNSAEFPDNYPIVRRHYDCAVAATYDRVNHLADYDRHNLQRLSFESLARGYHTKSSFKARIKEAVDRGDWVIFASHFYDIEQNDVPDETSYSTANVYEILLYADSLCHIRPTAEVWAERKWMWELQNR